MFTNYHLISSVLTTNHSMVAWSPVPDEEIRDNLEHFFSMGKYKDAAQYCDIHLSQIQNDNNIHLENQVLHAKALMYVMDIESANQKYEEVLRTLLGKGLKTEESKRLFGLIVNNIGYQVCFYNVSGKPDNYTMACQLFSKSLEFFDCEADEYATSLDNLARAYAKLGEEMNAEIFANDALIIRSVSPDIDSRRTLLSQISLANIEFDLQKYDKAYAWANKAIQASTDEYPRGKALAHTIYGKVLAEQARYYAADVDYAKQKLESAQVSLRQAKEILENVVQEPFRSQEVDSSIKKVEVIAGAIYSNHKLNLPNHSNNGFKSKKIPTYFDTNRYEWLVNFQP